MNEHDREEMKVGARLRSMQEEYEEHFVKPLQERLLEKLGLARNVSDADPASALAALDRAADDYAALAMERKP